MADYALHGGLGSPYSMKMRALMRYRRLPHRWIMQMRPEVMAPLFAQVKAPVVPVLEFPDGAVMNDSTPLIFELERRHADRSVIPEDEAYAFLALLLEDFADEWGTKAMFHFRWDRERDQALMSRWLAFDRLHGQGREAIQAAADAFRARQVGRMALVGCTPENAPLIEASARAVYAILDDLAADSLYLFGARPSLADFAWFGELSQLATDPTPYDLMRTEAPYLMRWLTNLDDASGVEGDWGEPPAATARLLHLASELYLPFLAANAAAVQAGADAFTFEALGHGYGQAPFRYQAKCLAELRAAYGRLSSEARTRVDAALSGNASAILAGA